MFSALASLPEVMRERCLYLIAGEGSARPWLEQEAKRLQIDGIVRWLGYVPEEDLPDLYRAADLFVLCTRESRQRAEVEGFGLVFLESQACGVPVVGTRCGGIPSAIKENQSGWLIEQDDVARLAELVLRLVESPKPFIEMGLTARRYVEADCTWDHYFDQLMGILNARGIRYG